MLVGFTDNVGPFEANRNLSIKLAQQVLDFCNKWRVSSFPTLYYQPMVTVKFPPLPATAQKAGVVSTVGLRCGYLNTPPQFETTQMRRTAGRKYFYRAVQCKHLNTSL